MWKIEKTNDKKYAYLISIEKDEDNKFYFLCQKKWPSDDETVFCTRASNKPEIEAIETIEESKIKSCRWLEDKTKLSISLDRDSKKKCDFRFVQKKYKNKEAEYEQIFYRSKPDEKPASVWRIESTDSEKFPYKVSIIEKEKAIFSLLTQDKWPGASGNIFCIRAEDKSEIKSDQIIEEVSVVFVKRVGKRLSVMLDRSLKKRCEFLFLKKKYKTKEGEYEQIFFRTQQGISQHRTRGKLSLQPKQTNLDIIIDSNERYPWKFGQEHEFSRKNLSVGDYALIIDNEIEAVIERKTFDNLLGDISKIQVLHQQLTELSTYKHKAMVIEAQYGDFLSSEKIGKYMSVAQISRALAEISVLHHNLPIIFAGNRKEANYWSLKFFEGVFKKHHDPTNEVIAKAVAGARTSKSNPVWLKVKKAIFEEMPNEFSVNDIKHYLSEVSASQIRAQMKKLQDEGLIQNTGKGRPMKWVKVNKDAT